MGRKYGSQFIVNRIRDELCGPLTSPSHINGTRLVSANDGNVNGGRIGMTWYLNDRNSLGAREWQ